MPFSFQQLNRLNLERNEWVVIKYHGIDTYDSGQIATNQQWNAADFPIFDDDQHHIYIHFPRQTHASRLEIGHIEYFYRGKFHPWYVIQMGQVAYTFGKFHSLAIRPYILVKTNGEEEHIRFVENRLEHNGESLDCHLYYLDANGDQQHLSYFKILDVY